MKYVHIILCIFLLLIGIGFCLNSKVWLRRILTYKINPAAPPVLAYKNGLYLGDEADALYGMLQVYVAINNGKIVDIGFPQYPHDRNISIQTNMAAMPKLKQEAIRAQSAQVQIVSGATDSSFAFIKSLSSALAKAQ